MLMVRVGRLYSFLLFIQNFFLVTVVQAANQTATVSPVHLSGLPYRVELRNYDFGSAELPTL